MLKLLNFLGLLVTDVVENDRETGAKRGPIVPYAIAVLFAIVAIWAAVKFFWFWAFLAALAVIASLIAGNTRVGPGNDGVGE